MSAGFAEDFIKNGFTIKTYLLKKTKHTNANSCFITISYPEVYNDDLNASHKINKEIVKFKESYNFCNAKNMIIKYDILQANNDYFSIKWITSDQHDKFIRFDSQTFDINDGNLISFDKIVNPMANNFMKEIVKLSKGHVDSYTNWEQFLEKIEQRDIQFYILNSKWHIIFNPHTKARNILDVLLPDYLLKDL